MGGKSQLLLGKVEVQGVGRPLIYVRPCTVQECTKYTQPRPLKKIEGCLSRALILRRLSRRMSSSTSPAAPVAVATPAPAAALTFELEAVCGAARTSTLHLPHGPVRTPVFMPVGTQGSVKGLSTVELQSPPLDCDIILGNTYHLGNRPGGTLLERLGGLHSFMAWPRPILTDSGGFQMVSLLHLANITEEGVNFRSPVDGSQMLLTPEMSMQLQNQIGSDIMMALDDVVDSKTVDAARFEEACHRTLRWIDRCIAAHKHPADQALFGIVQGGLDVAPGGLRDVCLAGMIARDAQLPGYAIGGLAGGEEKDKFWRVVARCCTALPAGKPRYLMGVGYPLDIVVCTALGVDMYDCVYPTRTARFGTALVHSGLVKLKGGGAADDDRPIDDTCPCYVCAGYSRAYLYTLLKTESAGAQLVSYHNLAYMMRLTREMREAIAAGTYADYVRGFVYNMFPGGVGVPPLPSAGSGSAVVAGAAGGARGGVSSSSFTTAAASPSIASDTAVIPPWVMSACAAAGIDLSQCPSPSAAAMFRRSPGSILAAAPEIER